MRGSNPPSTSSQNSLAISLEKKSSRTLLVCALSRGADKISLQVKALVTNREFEPQTPYTGKPTQTPGCLYLLTLGGMFLFQASLGLGHWMIQKRHLSAIS